MLAGIEKAVYPRKPFAVSGDKSAIETLLAGLIDYAGLYPPASLDMRPAVENYRTYRSGKHAFALGRFIVNISRMDELLAVAGDIQGFRLSVIVSQAGDLDTLAKLIQLGVPIESIEIKAGSADMLRILSTRLARMETYVEIPVEPIQPDLLREISSAGGRVKLRMGGLVPEAFPLPAEVVSALVAFARTGMAFKATAGLHHPFRSTHQYAPDIPRGLMYGFVNLMCAAAWIDSGGDASEAGRILNERQPESWTLTREAIAWRSHSWTVDRLSEMRRKFISFGSCSFEEPIHDLEALGWL